MQTCKAFVVMSRLIIATVINTSHSKSVVCFRAAQIITINYTIIVIFDNEYFNLKI